MKASFGVSNTLLVAQGREIIQIKPNHTNNALKNNEVDFVEICGFYFPSLREQFCKVAYAKHPLSKVAYAKHPRPLVLREAH